MSFSMFSFIPFPQKLGFLNFFIWFFRFLIRPVAVGFVVITWRETLSEEFEENTSVAGESRGS